MGFDVEITGEGERSFVRLPEKVAAAVVELVLGGLSEAPFRAGKPLGGGLAGYRSARRGDYRVIYEVFENARVVRIHRVQHRRDVYCSR